ncbi:MAG: PD40 domain-containing protein [Bacteroidales bacterium]|nr:PD40 domain-containing protein [Bacteroidales bacterium]
MVNITSESQIYGYSINNLLRTVILLLFVFMQPLNLLSQELHTSSNRALRAYNDGKRAYDYVNYKEAEIYFRDAVNTDPGFIEAHLMLAELSKEMLNYSQSNEAYRNVMLLDSGFYIPAWYAYGEVQFLLGNYSEARTKFLLYLELSDDQPVNYRKARKYIMDCEFALEAVKNPVDFNPLNLGAAINTEDDEYWPAITADDNMLLFTRQSRIRGRGLLGRELQEDFYYSYRRDGEWTVARNAGPPLNTPLNEGAQALEAGGNYMYFTACNREDGLGGCDIYYSARTNSGWKKGINIGRPVNSRYWESQPSLSSDGSRLFFVSNRPGGYGGMDIWLSTIGKDGRWTEPANAGDLINTPGDEMSPFIHFDGRTLYFSSNGRPCMGGFDIFMSRLQSDSTWSEPENLGYPINTQADEIGLVINSSGEVAYFSSRVNAVKGRDLYYFEMPESLRPDPVSYLKGQVVDMVTGRKLRATYKLINLSTQDRVVQSFTDSDGNFLVCLPTGHNYGINVSSEGYLFYSENFMLEGEYSSIEPFEKTILLSPIRVGQKMSLYNVFFAFDSWELRDESIPELENLFTLLKNKAGLVVEIGGHTDSTGTDEHNLILSEKRAMAVRDYLVRRGLSHERLKYKGYGEKVPLFDNATEEGKRKNRRTEIRILEISE